MSEWWTYSLSDFLLFSPRTYHRLFELYNAEIWPAQIVSLALGAVLLGLVRRPWAGKGRLLAAILAGCWLWVAWAFHWQRYATINWAAAYFAVAFAIEGLLLFWTGVVRNRLAFEPVSSMTHRIGFGVVLFALAVQPLLGPLVGREWMQMEIFGVAPDPTVLATLGLLLTTARRVRRQLLVIPLLWCATTGAFQWAMGSPDALLMPLAAAAVVVAAGASRTG
jgi:hypothetical protein